VLEKVPALTRFVEPGEKVHGRAPFRWELRC
jgi:hypothetical protein